MYKCRSHILERPSVSIWSSLTVQLCTLQGRLSTSAIPSVWSQKTARVKGSSRSCSVEKIRKRSRWCNFISNQVRPSLDNRLLVSLISVQVHFSLDYFNNFVVSATVIQIQAISDLYLWEVNTQCFSYQSLQIMVCVGGRGRIPNSSVVLSEYLDFPTWFS